MTSFEKFERLGLSPTVVAPAQHITRPEPINLVEEDRALFAHEFEHDVWQSYYFNLPDAHVVGRDIINRPMRLFREHTRVVTRRKFKLREIVRLHLRDWLLKPIEMPDAIWATDNWSFGYFHWILDVLPRLAGCPAEARAMPLLIPSTLEKFGFVRQSLDLVGQAYRFYDVKRPLRIKNLLVTSHVSLTGHYNPELLRRVRADFYRNVDDTGPGTRRIYISRSRAPKRKIVNEDEILPVLKAHGFEIHHMEDYSLKDQVALMRSCKVIAGLHGAGLTNALFMPEGGTMLEVRNAGDHWNNCFYTLAAACDHRYAYVIGSGDTIHTNFANITVDPKAFEAALSAIA